MSLVTSNPLQEFYKTTRKSPVKTLKVASPFITGPGIQLIIDEFRTRRTRIQIITNLSELNVALSLSNPVAPLLEIIELMGNRIEIKSHPMLHAKLYLADGRTALMGSSNLTYGGMERNVELNWLVKGRKGTDREQLVHLATWFGHHWEKSGTPLSKSQLLEIEKRWQAGEGRLKGLVGNLIPEPRLGGEYWGKIRAIQRKKTWKIQAIHNLLSVDSEKTAKNSSQKLIFLKNLGLIEYDEKSVRVLKKISSPDQRHYELPLGDN